MKEKTKNEQQSLKDFGKRVRQLRVQKGVSQEELAEAANLHRTYIGMVERGEKNVTLLTLMRLARALDADVTRMIDGLEKNGK